MPWAETIVETLKKWDTSLIAYVPRYINRPRHQYHRRRSFLSPGVVHP